MAARAARTRPATGRSHRGRLPCPAARIARVNARRPRRGVGRGRRAWAGGWSVISGAPHRQYRLPGGLVRPHARQLPVPVDEPTDGTGRWIPCPVAATVAGCLNRRRCAVLSTGGSRRTRPDRGPRSLTTVGIRRAVGVGVGAAAAAGGRGAGGRGAGCSGGGCRWVCGGGGAATDPDPMGGRDRVVEDEPGRPVLGDVGGGGPVFTGGAAVPGSPADHCR